MLVRWISILGMDDLTRRNSARNFQNRENCLFGRAVKVDSLASHEGSISDSKTSS
jgi:hypothetical protein